MAKQSKRRAPAAPPSEPGLPRTPADRRSRRDLIALALLAPAAFAAGWFVYTRQTGTSRRLPGGPFRLRSHTGEIVDSKDLTGKPFGVFFGFTHCPDICPSTMTELTQSLADLGDAGRDLRIYFISVDPERDTPELMREYLSSFDPRIVGLSGTASEIEAVAKQYGAFYQKVPTKDGDYTMNHTAVVYLMDRHGKFLDVLSYEEPHATQVEKLTALLKHG